MVDERKTRIADSAEAEPPETSPWHHVPLRTIAAIAAPFWGYITLSNLGSFSVVLKILRELVRLYPEMRRRPAQSEGDVERQRIRSAETT